MVEYYPFDHEEVFLILRNGLTKCEKCNKIFDSLDYETYRGFFILKEKLPKELKIHLEEILGKRVRGRISAE